MLTSLLRWPLGRYSMASAAAAIGALSLAACKVMPKETEPPSDNGFMADMPPKLSQALEDAGFPDVSTAVLVQPDGTGEKFRVFIRGFTETPDFAVAGDNFVVLPRLAADGLAAQRIGELETLVILLEQSPETVIVCDKSGGDKICWEEER